MKALTICQPYAELIARGEKLVENRTWATSYRGLLLIHAGKSRAWLDPDMDAIDYPDGDLVFGAFVAVGQLVACLDRGEAEWPPRWSHLRHHAHAHGPICWVLEHVRRLPSPIPAKGRQGLWVPDRVVVDQVTAMEVNHADAR